VRDHIEVAAQVMAVAAELRQEIQENLEEGLRRDPERKSFLRVRQWLFEG
jgi:hypothetical protein